MVTYVILGVAILLIIKKIIDKRNSTVKSISGAEARAAHAEGKATFIDVRTPAEVSQGKLEGAIEANVTSIMFKKQIVNLDKSKPYIVYCRSGMRSSKACKMMEKAGFTDLTNLSGGYMSLK